MSNIFGDFEQRILPRTNKTIKFGQLSKVYKDHKWVATIKCVPLDTTFLKIVMGIRGK